MKLSKLYSNQPNLFQPIIFNQGLNFIYADIRQPKNQQLDSHNLGKTTLARLLDFMFLAKKHREQFLFANEEIFKSFIFFLEIQLATNHYLTIKRGVTDNTKIFFKEHETSHQDYRQLHDEGWSFSPPSFDKAKQYLDGKLNLTAVKHGSYRQIINYLIRTQEDFGQVFQLNKYRGKDSDWKPYMADLLGFNGNLATQQYQIKKQIADLKTDIKNSSTFNEKNASEALSKVDNDLLIRTKELADIQDFVANFNFHEIDQKAIEELVASIDKKIVHLNMQEYSLKNSIYHIEQSFVEDKIKFNPQEVQQLFHEANVLFAEQVVKDFEQLIAFNHAITKERNEYLKQELEENKVELSRIQDELENLNLERAKQLEFLQESELINKFKDSNRQVSEIQSQILYLEQQKKAIEHVLDLQKKQGALESSLVNIKNQIQTDMTKVNNSKDSIFSQIRLYFHEIIMQVLDKNGQISVFLNSEDNFEFKAEYHNKKGIKTDESKGSTYHKFLCIAFDLAVTRTYLGKNFPQFIYIDGVFDALDNRKKQLLLEILRKYADIGIQIIATTINSEVQGLITPLEPSEIILTLHDDGQDGRLFKMPTW